MTMAEYLSELAFRLRWRHVGEARVRQELSRVADEVGASGADPEERFGPPADHARSIARGKSPSRGYLLASALVAVAVVVVAVRVVSSLVLGQEQNPWISLAVYAGAFAWAVVGTAVGARLDRRLPAER